MASVIQDLITELRAALDRLAPEVDALRKFIDLMVRFGISEPSRLLLETLYQTHLMRRERLQNAMNDNLALVADGYPEDIPGEVPAELIAEIEAIRDFITELLGTLDAIPTATSLNLTVKVEPEGA